MKSLHKKIIDLAYKLKISHIGSAISCVDIIDKIYSSRKIDDIFVLSCGHAGLALYAVLEKYFGIDAELLYNLHGIHPHLDKENHIDCSTGSLGCGLPISIGYAIGKPNIRVSCLISDGECCEGSVWESLQIINEFKIPNIDIYVSMNGYSAYKEIDIEDLSRRLSSFLPSVRMVKTDFGDISLLSGLDAHYKIITDKEYHDLQQ